MLARDCGKDSNKTRGGNQREPKVNAECAKTARDSLRITNYSMYFESPDAMDNCWMGRERSCSALVANSGEISIVTSGSPSFVGTFTPASCSHRAARRI